MNITEVKKCLKFRNGAEFAIVNIVGNGTKASKPLFKKSKFGREHKVVGIYWEAKSGLVGISFADGSRDYQKKYGDRALQFVFCTGVYKVEIHKSGVI